MKAKTRWNTPFAAWENDLKCEFVAWLVNTYGEKSAHDYFNEFRAVKDVEASVAPPVNSMTEALAKSLQNTKDRMAANILTQLWGMEDAK